MINPFWSLGGNVASPISAASAVGNVGGTAATTAGFPWAILPIIFSFLQSSGLFGQTDQSREDERFQQLIGLLGQNQGYRGSTGLLKTLDPVMLQAILGNLKRSANWGWPAGKSMDLSFLDNLLKGLPSSSLGAGTLRRKTFPE